MEEIKTIDWVDAVLVQLAEKYDLPQKVVDNLIWDYEDLTDFLVLKKDKFELN
ncbi:MAG: hypothetical protein IIC75_08970 [Bacteroidetes bacterium]|nr:hypothetical protein [Bacteroidota bacterium]